MPTSPSSFIRTISRRASSPCHGSIAPMPRKVSGNCCTVSAMKSLGTGVRPVIVTSVPLTSTAIMSLLRYSSACSSTEVFLASRLK